MLALPCFRSQPPRRIPRRSRRLPASVSPARVLGAVAACALTVSSCGADSRKVRFPGSKVTLRLDEYRIVPRTASVRPGRLKIVAQNAGVLTHNVRIQSFRPDSSGSPTIHGATPTAHPGETVSTKITLGPGRYKLICTLGNHGDLGQTGTLIVE